MDTRKLAAIGNRSGRHRGGLLVLGDPVAGRDNGADARAGLTPAPVAGHRGAAPGLTVSSFDATFAAMAS